MTNKTKITVSGMVKKNGNRPLFTIHYLPFTILLFLAVPMFGQQEMGLHFMRHVWQSNTTNPAFLQENKLVIGLPGVRNNLVFDGPTYNEIVTQQNGKAVVDIDRFIANLQPQNSVRNDLAIPTLSAAFRLGNATFSLGHSVKYNAFFKYPKALPQVIWQGNGQFIGETVDLSNELQITGYQELGIGAAYKFGPVTLGVKGKFLGGISDASTDENHHSASLYTDPDVYQITLNGDYILHTVNSVEYNNFDDISANFDFGKLTFQDIFSQNKGFAVDLGIRAEIGKLDLSAAMLDLGGKINWDNNVKNYSATRTIQYDGLDFSQALTGDEVDFGSALDTLEQLFEVEESSTGYTSKLPRKMYLSALYKLNETWTFGGALFNENYRGESSNAVAVSASMAVVKALTVGATYAVKENKSYDNLGLNLTLKLGPVQVFGVTDNIISAFRAGDSKNFNARFGASLLFF